MDPSKKWASAQKTEIAVVQYTEEGMCGLGKMSSLLA